MVKIATEIPLFSDPIYQYNISIENRSRQLRFKWNDRTSSWYMDLYNEDGTEVLLGIKLVPQYPIAVDYNMGGYGLTGFFILLQKNINQLGRENSLITDIPERYSMFYINNEGG